MSAQLQVTGEAKIRDIQGPVVANSGVITALDGAASQYVRGDGTLADFPTSSGGGSSVSYYLNSSVSQGTIGGVAYRELSKDPIIGAGTDIPISTNGYVANYITDVNDPDVVLVPGGNFNCEFYFSVNNNTGNPTTYAELYKYDGTTFTLLGTSAGVPESINQGTTIAPYYFAIPVATAALSVTDRLAIRIYVNVDGRTVTLHTENGHLCQVVTTLSKGMVSLNNLTDQSQYLATGTSGTNFAIVSSGDTHTFNLPVASATNTGKLSSTDWSTFNNKVPYTGAIASVDLGIYSLDASELFTNGNGIYIKTNLSGIANSVGYVALSSSTYKLNVAEASSATNAKIFNFDFSTLSDTTLSVNNTRTFTLPDLSGTLALLEADNMFTQVNMFDQSVNFKANGSLVGTSGYISQAYAKTGSGAGSTLSLKIQDGNSLKAINLDFVGSPATYTYTYPALSGTIALLEGTQTFSGAKTFSGLASFTNTSGINLQYGAYINKGNTPLVFSSGTTNIYSDATTNNIVIRDNLSIAKLEFNNSTQTYTFPAASGTLALTSNLSAYVPYTGATANVDLGTNSISSSFIYANGVSGFAGSIYLKQTTSIQDSSSGYSSMSAFGASSLHFSLNNGTLNRRFRINSVNLDGTNIRTYLLPDADGTIALTSNLSAYLPLTGGTLTGALSGTSATFTNTSTFRATGNAYTNGSIILQSSTGATSTYLTNSGGIFYLSNNGSTDHLQIASTGAATFSGGLLTVNVATDNTTVGIFHAGGGTANRGLKISTFVSVNDNAGVRLDAQTTVGGATLALATAGVDRLTIANTGAATFNIASGGYGATFNGPSYGGLILSNGGTANTYFVGESSLLSIEHTTAINLRTNNENRVRITSGGNVGIGTSSPTGTYGKLSVAGGISILNDNNAKLEIGRYSSGVSNSYIKLGASSNSLIITNNTDTADLFTITNGGNVGIGTTSPNNYGGFTNLQVNGTTNGLIQVSGASSTLASFYAGNGQGQIGTTSNHPFILFTNDTERMRITSGGKVGIGTSSVNNEMLTINQTSGNSSALLVNTSVASGQSYGLTIQAGTNSSDRSFAVFNQGGSSEYFSVRGDGYLKSPTTYNNTTASPNYLSISTSGFFERFVASSARYKEEIKDWDVNGLDIILALRPRTYKYKKEYYNKADVDFLGLIAEEVAEVNTYLADYENEDGTGQVENVRYATIVVPLIKAVQELEARIKQLENK